MKRRICVLDVLKFENILWKYRKEVRSICFETTDTISNIDFMFFERLDGLQTNDSIVKIFYHYDNDKNQLTIVSNSCDIIQFDGNINWLFAGCKNLYGIYGQVDTTLTWSMEYVFSDCDQLVDVDICKYFNTENVLTIKGLFLNCKKLRNLKQISHFDLSNCLDCSESFKNNQSLTTLTDFYDWNLFMVTNAQGMFSGCENIKTLKGTCNLNFKHCLNISHIFFNCKKLYDISAIKFWHLEQCNYADFAFANTHISTLKCFDGKLFEFLISADWMFANCKRLKYDENIQILIPLQTSVTSIFIGCNPQLNLYVM